MSSYNHPKCAVLGPYVLGKETPQTWTCMFKSDPLPNMWQSVVDSRVRWLPCKQAGNNRESKVKNGTHAVSRCVPKFSKFWANLEDRSAFAVYKSLFRSSPCCLVLTIFALKSQSCRKTAQNKPDYLLLLSKFCISITKHVSMIMYV